MEAEALFLEGAGLPQVVGVEAVPVVAGYPDTAGERVFLVHPPVPRKPRRFADHHTHANPPLRVGRRRAEKQERRDCCDDYGSFHRTLLSVELHS